MYNPIVNNFLLEHEISTENTDEIEEFFLNIEKLSVTINSKLIAYVNAIVWCNQKQ